MKRTLARAAILSGFITALSGFALASAQASTFTYVTDFTKTANTQTNAFPGYPSGTFTANNAYHTTFDITSDASGNNFYDFNNNSNTPPLDISVSLYGVTDIFTLINAYHPGTGSVGAIEFKGSNGTDQVFSLSADPNAVGGADVRDFYQGSYNNTINASNVENAYLGTGAGGAGTGNVNTGGYGNYVIDEQDFKLQSAFATQTLTDIVLHPTPASGGGVPILFGVTAESGVSAVPLPAALPLLGTAVAALAGISWNRKRKTAA